MLKLLNTLQIHKIVLSRTCTCTLIITTRAPASRRTRGSNTSILTIRGGGSYSQGIIRGHYSPSLFAHTHSGCIEFSPIAPCHSGMVIPQPRIILWLFSGHYSLCHVADTHVVKDVAVFLTKLAGQRLVGTHFFG